jgi:hypothetical protein
MANMTDQARINSILTFLFTGNPNAGTAITVTTPYKLRLMTANGTNTAGSNGTENTTSNSPGYTALGSTLGAPFVGTPSAGQASNVNAVTWTATGTWTAATVGVEIWDSASTPLRWLLGALTSTIAANAVANTDTVTFAVGAITVNASAW